MEDMAAKIQEILSDEESMKQISELAQMFSSSGSDDSGENTDSENASAVKSDDMFSGFDFSKLMMLQNVMGNAQNDQTSRFLVALRPLLKEERREKVDRAVKMLRIFAAWEVLKESGVLNDFFGEG